MRWRVCVSVGLLASAIGLSTAWASSPSSPSSSSSPSSKAAPAKVVIERVIAVVDRTPITLWELHRRLAPQLATLSRSKPVTAVKERSLAAALLEQLIDERIVALRAAELGLAVGEQEVDRAAALVAEQSRISVEQLYAHALSDAYLDRERYRDELRRQLLTARVLQIELANAPKHGSSAERMQISQSRFMKAERKRLRVRVLVSW